VTRTLTEAEAQVIGALLASTRVTERSRLQRAAVPRSTFHAARRRAYAEGWLRDRYIPNPATYGLPFVGVVLARPFADRLAPFLEDRANDESTIFLASSPQIVLSIGWYPTQAQARHAVERPQTAGFASWSFPLVAETSTAALPVYFDFEGTFAHLRGDTTPEGYPQGLGGAIPTLPRTPGTAVELRSTWGVTELVHRPFDGDTSGRAPHLVGPFGLPWGQQRLLNHGWVSHRVLLDPARLPGFRGRLADQQVFVVGTLLGGVKAPDVFEALTRDCRVFPYLFAASEGRVLIGALGQGPGSRSAEASVPPRAPVLRTLRERMEGIEILQESAPAFQLTIDHRYDRLFPRKGG